MICRPKLLELRPQGLYCPLADVYIDPHRSVPRAIITHGHADHARAGMGAYLTAQPGVGILHTRLGVKAQVQGLDYGQVLDVNGVKISLHPAGHVLGSAQVRLEYAGQVWVVTGDYKLVPDPSCQAYEPVPCQVFVSECTFGLPLYRWPQAASVHAHINEWWAQNAQMGLASVLYCYSLGKAQRLLKQLDPGIGPIIVHPAAEAINRVYMNAGIHLHETHTHPAQMAPNERGRAMYLLPAAAAAVDWLPHLGHFACASASGWLQSSARRKTSGMDACFVLSDHCDWDELHQALELTGAETVYWTHGFEQAMITRTRQLGLEAHSLEVLRTPG